MPLVSPDTVPVSLADGSAGGTAPKTRRELIAAERLTDGRQRARGRRGAVAPHASTIAPHDATARVAGPRVRTPVVRARRGGRGSEIPLAIAAAPARPPGVAFRRTASGLTGVGALLFAAGLVVSTSVPAQALFTPTQIHAVRTSSASASGQSLTVGEFADGAATRDGYTVTEAAEQPSNVSGTFTNDPNGTIQWPFLVGVPITSGFGARNVEGCSFCSTFHEGVDFAPGAGTAIRSVAAGTVIKVKADDGGFGNDVWVQHDVDGKQFVSVYGHMLDGSFKVTQGQTVTVGQELGQVGSTGNSTGPHLHLEIHLNGVPVDPYAWLKANAN